VKQLYQTLVRRLTPAGPAWPWHHADMLLTGKIMKLANLTARAHMAARGMQLALLRTRADRAGPLQHIDCAECGAEATDPSEHPFLCADTMSERKALVTELRSILGETAYRKPVYFADVPGLQRRKCEGEDSWRICLLRDIPPGDGRYVTLAATWNDTQLAALAKGGIEKGQCRSIAAQMTVFSAVVLWS
jgi:hypothetical protein